MTTFIGIVGVLIILTALWDAFETIILPRRVSRNLRITRLVYTSTWAPWRMVVHKVARSPAQRERMVSPYGPLTVIFLLGIWAILLIIGFAMLQWAAGSHLKNPTGPVTFGTELYMSGTTFFTLGLGDVTPVSVMARMLTVAEGGTGFGLLALVIGYVPILYQSFSRRETSITLLDARAGSPPSGAELLRRHWRDAQDDLEMFLGSWEQWSAELLESHLSYPMLMFFRSQHDNQSWLASLTMVMDACALITVSEGTFSKHRARLTFAIARHASVDLSQILHTKPHPIVNRLPREDFSAICAMLNEFGDNLHDDEAIYDRLNEIRATYEPFIGALAKRLAIDLPPWLPADDAHDDWETSAWERPTRQPMHLPFGGH